MNLPTRLTVLRIILTPLFIVLLFNDGLKVKVASFFVFVLASLTDWYDGYFAKKYGHVTVWGKFLDPLADKILVSAAFIAFYILGYVKLWVIVVIISRDVLITGLRSYALLKKHPVATISLAQVKTFIQMGSVYVIFIFLLFDQYAIERQAEFTFLKKLKSIHFIDNLMLIVVFLTVFTAVKYFVYNRSH
ncbi:MAG TPA: CDP-diacylglycerol--glycerol-3-phosphate 3-phosphatidyltransferase, partial [bacterium]|nr:CDP-diacylglycerol--glycerol-3-phosphate 3-phosphatidyltransferase [bacterium]